MNNNIKISWNIESEINDITQESIKQHVNKNLDTKIDSYFRSVITRKPDSEIKVDFKIEKLWNAKYETKLFLNIDGKNYSFKKNTEWDEDVYKLIDNLFKTVKSELSDEQGR